MKLGEKCSEETKRKMSEAQKGNKKMLGKHHSEETKRRISESLKGRPVSMEKRRRISETLKGRTHSDEQKKKAGDARLGHEVSEETRRKISKAQRGVSKPGHKHTEETKRKISKSRMGWKYSEETKRKISEATKGEKSHNWKGGVTTVHERIRSSAKYRSWRKSVFERDEYICQKTLTKCEESRCHHIENFCNNEELRFVVNNGITLSKESHMEFHKIYGQFNNTREQLEEYLDTGFDAHKIVS